MSASTAAAASAAINAASSSRISTSSSLRIASLLPSTTDIVSALGLSEHLVGVTHECQIPEGCSPGLPHILTSSLLNYEGGQGDIDAKVKEAAADAAACKMPSVSAGTSNGTNISNNASTADDIADSVQSLYPIDREALKLASPTVVLTQDLCGVCAPSTAEVKKALSGTRSITADTATTTDGVKVLSLEPESLQDVADTFVTVADGCGVHERGIKLRDEFMLNLQLLKDTVDSALSTTRDNATTSTKPRVLLLEWLDPPYDGGHWIPGMVAAAGCEYVKIGSHSSPSPDSWNGTKSKQVTWEDVYGADPDVVLVACCGFDLKRNIKDALGASDKLAKLRAAKEGRLFACDGDKYFARPGPMLLHGANISAQCAFDGLDRNVTAAVQSLDFAPQDGEGWSKVDVIRPSAGIADIEDQGSNEACWAKLHQEACNAGQMHYVDPSTSYHVFTEVAHKKRGACCGSGCRHCPYNHEKVRADLKADVIKQPSFLYERADKSLFVVPESSSFSSTGPERVKILFFSGGKDSFLALRALVRQGMEAHEGNINAPFGIVLLTTFDATSRVIAHQEVHIRDVMKQATALDIPLVGIPLHRGTSESYVDRLRRGVELVSSSLGKGKSLTLAFGDLHLSHIKEWRDDALGGDLKYELEYPCWKVSYESLLDDLEASGVKCIVSASSTEVVKEGEMFGRDLYNRSLKNGVDGFGEEGEFHSLAQVWEVDRKRALDL